MMKTKLRRTVLLALLALAVVVPSEAADKVRMGMIKFESKAEGVQDKQAEIITDIFTNVLSGAKNISVLERAEIQRIGEELKFNMSGLVDPATAAAIGKVRGLQYMVMGSVTELYKKAGGGAVPLFFIPGSIGGADITAYAKIDVRVIDVETTEVIAAFSERGMSKNSSQAFNFYGVRWGETEFGGLEARAIADASLRVAYHIRERMGNEYSYVLSGSGDEFVIDAGNMMGVQEGVGDKRDGATLFLVYIDGETIRGLDNQIISRKKIPLAVLKVKTAESDHSICTVAPPTSGKVIQRGDKIEPISSEEAKTIKGTAKRPDVPQSTETFNEIFGTGDTSPPSQPAQPQPPAPGTAETAQPAPVAQPAQPASQPAQSRPSGSYQWRDVDGVDPNSTTDAKLVDIYPLSSQERNAIGIKHRGAWNMYSKGSYKEAFEIFTQLAFDYECNYLSAYWAGMAALKIGSAKEAAKWFDQALAINPGYQPAIDAKTKLGDEPVNKPTKTKKKTRS
jgi:curli biogenesis system outer membrane secretion channel CsgG/TolA-binding protein